MRLLLDHPDSPYIRAMGFLYLRYVGDPKTVWDWIEPYLYDAEPLTVTATANKVGHGAGGKQQRDPQTVGDLVRRLFSSERDYYGTMLPRFPIQIERDLQVRLLLADQIQDRADRHLADRKTMDHFQTLGSRVMALYGDDDNPVQWYEAVVDRVITRDDVSSQPLAVPKFVVTFPQYGNTETVSLGEMEMCGVALEEGDDSRTKRTVASSSFRGGSTDTSEGRPPRRGYEKSDGGRDWKDGPRIHSRGDGGRGHQDRYESESSFRDRGNRGRGGGNGPTGPSSASNGSSSARILASENDLYEEVRRRERDNVMASGKHSTAHRRAPPGKARLEAPSYGDSGRTRSPILPDLPQAGTSTEGREPNPDEAHGQFAKKRSAEEMAAIQEKKRKLMAKYG
jgi:pre-mRNA-splicing factor 38B